MVPRAKRSLNIKLGFSHPFYTTLFDNIKELTIFEEVLDEFTFAMTHNVQQALKDEHDTARTHMVTTIGAYSIDFDSIGLKEKEGITYILYLFMANPYVIKKAY